jgi:hypothetical protein
MTTVIIDFDSKGIYADSRATSSGLTSTNIEGEYNSYDNYVEKIRTLGEGRYSVGCGSLEDYENFVYDMASRITVSIPTKARNSFYVVSENLRGLEVWEYSSIKEPSFFMRLIGRKYKWKIDYHNNTTGYIVAGSGSSYARGALKFGASPEEAIRCAAMCDEYTNNTVVSCILGEIEE